MIKKLPQDLTSYDFIKAFALVTMIVDHIGYYFYPDDMWWRAVGRLSFPIWIFLTGYAQSRDFPPRLIAGAIFLELTSFAAGMAILPLNILFTVIILRLSIDTVMQASSRLQSAFWATSLLCILMFLPTDRLFEYGTIAVMFAMFGYMVRRRGEGIFTTDLIRTFMIVLALVFVFYEKFIFNFDRAQLTFVAAGTAILCLTLSAFRPATYPQLTRKLTARVTSVIQFCGRRTLEIYIAHLVLFKIAMIALGRPEYMPFNFHIF